MHHCLYITEVLTSVFDNFDVGRYAGEGRTLFALARTCRNFKEPALNALWRRLDESVWPLIQCLPGDAWEERREPHPKLHLLRPLTSHDLSVMKTYTSRVRSIGHSGAFTSRDVDVDVYRAISLLMPPTPLFPNLRRFEWTDTRDDVFPHIRIFLGGSLLSELRIIIRGSEMAKLSLLPYLREHHPRIQKAEFITDADQSQAMIRAMSELICGWRHLEELKCDLLTNQALVHLAHLPTLRSLRVTMPSQLNELEVALNAQAVGPTPFPALKDVWLSTESLQTLNGILQLLSPSAIENLSLFPGFGTPTRDWKTCIDTLRDKVLPSSLRDITFCEDYTSPVELSEGHVISIDMIRPLVAFSNLTNVSLDPNVLFDINNDALKELSIAWPRLRSLELGPSNGHKRPYGITLEGLVPLLQNCPELYFLGIVVDASHVEDYAATTVQNLTIAELNLGESELHDPTKVAAYLLDILPNLEEIYAWDEDHMRAQAGAKRYRRRWQKVVKILLEANGSDEEHDISSEPSSDGVTSDASL